MKNLHTFVAEAIMNKDSRQTTADLVEVMEVNTKGEALAKIAQQVLETDMANKELVADVIFFMANTELKATSKKRGKNARDEERYQAIAKLVIETLSRKGNKLDATSEDGEYFTSSHLIEVLAEDFKKQGLESRTGKEMTDKSLNSDLLDMEKEGLIQGVQKVKFLDKEGKKIARKGYKLA